MLRFYLKSFPKLNAVSDMTGQGLGMDYLINMLSNNEEMPKIGDIINHLESCGMGASIRRHYRYRATRFGPYPRSIICQDINGEDHICYPYNMRKHTELKGVWFLCN